MRNLNCARIVVTALSIAYIAASGVARADLLPAGPFPPIHAAADQGDTEFIARWIHDGKNVDEEFDDVSFTLRTGKNQVRKVTPLMFAAQRGNLTIVKMLVEAGADLDKRSTYAVPEIGVNSVLDYAIEGGNLQMVEYVWNSPKRKLDAPNLRRNFITAFTGACQPSGAEPWADVSRFLLKTFDPARANPAMKMVTSEKCPTLVPVLRDTQIKPDAEVLLAAAERGDASLARIYVSKGAPVNAPQFFTERTSLMLAAMRPHVETMTALLDAGAGIDLQDAKGATALILVAQTETGKSNCTELVEAIKLLKGRGANPDVTDKDGLRAEDYVEKAPKSDCTAKERVVLKAPKR